MKFLLAVDGSRYTRRMLTYIASNELMFHRHYDYVLVHVQPKSDRRPIAANDDPVLTEAGTFLQSHGFLPTRILCHGAAAMELINAANRPQCNMVVMGCRGLSPLKTAVLGSVTSQVLASSHVPVLVIR